MKGLLVWAHSQCPSTVWTYKALADAFGVPLHLALHEFDDSITCVRERETGTQDYGLAAEGVFNVGENAEVGNQILCAHRGWNHLFGTYQSAPNYRRLIVAARAQGDSVGVMAESPQNMFPPGLKRLAKYVYLGSVLKYVVRDVPRCSDFIVNASGNDPSALMKIGWRERQIIPFGYYPQPFPGTVPCRHTNRPFVVLLSGVVDWFRGADLLPAALMYLKGRGIPFKAVVARGGPLQMRMREFSVKNNLPIVFNDFTEKEELARLYGECSVYVGAGRCEPWGMRLNDAAQAGAPLLVSSGMGGRKLVEDFGGGLVFKNGLAADLGIKLASLATDRALYDRLADEAYHRACEINTQKRAAGLAKYLADHYSGWGCAACTAVRY